MNLLLLTMFIISWSRLLLFFFFFVLAYGQPREFAVCPLNTNDEINSWLKHFEVTSPLICQSVLVSKDPVGEISNLSEMD